MTRVAAVDCGTNTIRLLVSEYEGGKVRDIHRTMEVVRLGEGVDATGAFAPAAIERTRVALEKYVEIMAIERVEHVRMAATSATRDAANRDEFFTMTSQLLSRISPGAVAEVISGEEEAALSFTGAVGDLTGAEGPLCVIDLGGGSTEFVVGDADGTIKGAYSVNIGCVRLTERLLRTDPATAEEIAKARDVIDTALADVAEHVPVASARTWVGCAGTFTTLSALAQGLEVYDPEAIHGSVLRFTGLTTLTGQLVSQTINQRAQNPVIHPGRADVLSGGSLVVEQIMKLASNCGVDRFTVSEKDILDGLVAGLVAQL